MSGRARPRVLVAGIGNSDRGDDGLGPAVISRLRGEVPEGVRILECSGDVLALIQEWAGFSTVIVVDAAAPLGQAGRIHRLDLTGEPLPVAFACSSTHAFGVAEAVELARSLGRLPSHLIAYLVEGSRFDIGAPFSPAVAKAADRVAERILVELSRISGARQPEGADRHA
jgi:hydrogenase maturation protease